MSICKGKHSVSKGARGARGVRSLRTEWPSMAGVAACGAVRPRARLLQQGPAPPPRRARPHAPPLHRPCPEGTVRSRRLPTHGTRTARSAWPQLTAHTRLRLIFTVTMLSPEAVEKHAACKRQRLTVRISFLAKVVYIRNELYSTRDGVCTMVYAPHSGRGGFGANVMVKHHAEG